MSAAFAVVGAALSLAAVALDFMVLAAALVLLAAALTLVAAPRRDDPHGIEAATKGVLGVGFVLVLFALAIALAWAAGGDAEMRSVGRALSLSPTLGASALALVVIALAVLLGAVPLHQTFVDVTHGAFAASSALLGAGTLVAAGSATLRLADALLLAGPVKHLSTAWAVLAVITLIGAPIAALDQTRVGRVAAYLAVVPGGLVLAACATLLASPSSLAAGGRAAMGAVVAGALGAAAALLGVVVPRLQPSSTWEDWAGFGRRRPVIAAFLVYALGTVAGVPGTAGFDARLDVARAAFAAGLDALGLVTIASAAVGAAPLVRLALFLFSKEPPPRPRAQDPHGPLLLVAFAAITVAAAALAAAPWILDAVLLSMRP